MHGNSSVYATACMLQENGEYMKTMIIYKSKHGAGKEVAQYVQQKLSADLREADSALSCEGYERIICVGSIYAGRLAKQLIACIHANTQELAGKSVCMLLCGMSDAAPEKIITENLGEAFYQQLAFSVHIGGKLDFHKLGFLERTIIRMVNKQEQLYEDKAAVVVDRLRWETIDRVVAELIHEA